MFKKSPILGALGTIAALAVLGSTVPVAASPAHASTPCAVFLPSDPPPDAVRINLVNHDFGGGAGLDENNDAENCGTLTWDLANGTIKPRLTGTLYAKNAIGTRVRMSLRHRDVDGTLLRTTNSLPKDVLSDDVEEFPIDLFGYSSPLIYQVDVELQQEISPNVWDVRGSQTVYIGSSTKAPDSVRLLGFGEDFGSGNFTVARRLAAGPSRGTWPTTRSSPGSRATCTCRTAWARTSGCGCATTTSTATTSVAPSAAVRSRRRTSSRRSRSTWPSSATRRSTRPRSPSRSTSSGRGPRPTPSR